MVRKLPEIIDYFTKTLKKHRFVYGLLIVFFFFFATLTYLFPLIYGLILLPLDLLVSNYHPWYIPAQILLKNPYMQDSIIQLYPWKHLVFESFSQGIIPFWNPYQHMGMPFMASMKPAVFYPFNALYLLGEINAWNALLFLQIFLSMVFTYSLLRSFKLGLMESVLASFAFSFSSLMIGVLEFGSEGHVLLWLPLFILCVKKYLEKQEGRYLFILGVSLATSIFAGHLQYTGYALVALVGFALFYGYVLKTKIATYIFLFSAIALGVGISAIQLIPSIELFSNSYRGIADTYEIFSRGLIKPWFLLRLFSPDYFGNPVTGDLAIAYIETSGYFGIIPLFFALYAIVFSRKNVFVKFFAGVFIVSILFSLQGIGQLLHVLKVPLLTSGEANRIFYLAIFSGAILSGFGLSHFVNTNNKKRNIASLGAFTLVVILAIAVTQIVHMLNHSGGTFISNIKFSLMILILFLSGTVAYYVLKRKIYYLKAFFLIFVVALTFLDLFRMGYRFLTFSNQKFLYSDMSVTNYVKKEANFSLARNIGLTEPELATYLGVYTLETYNPLYLLRNAKLLHALQGKDSQELPINKYFLSNKTENIKQPLDFLGVSLVVMSKDSNPSIELFNSPKYQTNFEGIYEDDRYRVYKNLSSYPRFQLYYDSHVVDRDQGALALLASQDLDFKNKVILEEKLPVSLENGTGSAELISENINEQKFRVKTDKPALFYISDTFYPGWKAEINNKETKIYRANYNLRAVLVPSGDSEIRFSYLPTNFYLALMLTVVSFLFLALGSALHKGIYGLVAKYKKH